VTQVWYKQKKGGATIASKQAPERSHFPSQLPDCTKGQMASGGS